MNQSDRYRLPNLSYEAGSYSRYRFVFLGFLFPVFHYLIMLLVQVMATACLSLVFSSESSITTEEIEKKILAFLTEYSDIFSLISACLTILLVIVVYRIICVRFQNGSMSPPSVKRYFSLNRINRGLVFKLLLLSFFFYHFVLGFLNLVGLLAPELMESYHDAAQSVDTGKSAFSLVLSFIALVIVAPVTEELVYRNMAIANMNSRLSSVASILISSLIFGLFHGNFVWMIYAGGIGILFGFLYVKSQSILVSLVVHIGFNLLGYIYSVLGNFVNGSAVTVVNNVSFCLIIMSLIGAPLVFLWIWLGLSHKEIPIK